MALYIDREHLCNAQHSPSSIVATNARDFADNCKTHSILLTDTYPTTCLFRMTGSQYPWIGSTKVRYKTSRQPNDSHKNPEVLQRIENMVYPYG